VAGSRHEAWWPVRSAVWEAVQRLV